MGIEFDSTRWARVKDTYRRWWAGDLERPLVAVTLHGYDAGRPAPRVPGLGFTAHYDPSICAEDIVDRWDYDLSTRYLAASIRPATSGLTTS